MKLEIIADGESEQRANSHEHPKGHMFAHLKTILRGIANTLAISSSTANK